MSEVGRGAISHSRPVLKVLGSCTGRDVPRGHMQRGEVITLFGGAAAAWPLAVRAQQPARRVYRVGYLATGSREQVLDLTKAFVEGLRSVGYRVGENLVIEHRFADGETERVPALAAELV